MGVAPNSLYLLSDPLISELFLLLLYAISSAIVAGLGEMFATTYVNTVSHYIYVRQCKTWRLT